MDEMYYYSFCIGYDLMNKFFSNSPFPESDLVFEESKKIAKKFMRSVDYRDMSKSGYEKLSEWLEKNREKIERQYCKPIKNDKEMSL